MNKEQMLEVSEKSMAAFVSKLGMINALQIAHGAAIMPRAIWAQGIVASLIDAGIVQSEEQAEKANVILASDLGNSSQLGAMLLKKGVLKQDSAQAAASSFAAQLAKAAAARA